MKFFSILIIITQFFISVAFANDATTSVVKTPEFVCKEDNSSNNENFSEMKVYFISRYPEWNVGDKGLFEVILTSKKNENQNEVKYYFDEDIQGFFQAVKDRNFSTDIGVDKRQPTHRLSIHQQDQATLQLKGSDRLEKFNCEF